MTAELVAVELDRLNEFEHTIEVGLQTFEAVGHALGAIRDERLYRESHDTFEAYCTERWGFTDRRARQIIDAAETVAALPTGTMVPVSERQARELSGLPPETAAAVMSEAASNGTPTAASIKEARAHITQTSRTSEATKTEYDVDTVTGEIAEPNPIAAAVKAARTSPAHVAGLELERIAVAVRGIRNLGVSTVVADIGDNDTERAYAADLLETLNRVLPTLTDLQTRLTRRNLRSVK